MEFIGFAQSYDRYGGSSLFSPVANLLMVRLTRDYGAAVQSIYITAFLRSGNVKPRPTLESLFQQFHRQLDKLPKVTFRRKLKRIEIQFLSQSFMADDNESNRLSADKIHLAGKEVAEALTLMTKRIKATDDFDARRFMLDAAHLLTTRLTRDEWDGVRHEANEKWQAIRAAKSPWELLEIDWSQYHPRAREILDDPFYWENANDLAPNGNDTGADLLADFRRWEKRNSHESPLWFLERLLTGWGIAPIGWDITDEDAVQKLEKQQPIPLNLCNEAAIALAFAVIKLRGICPADLAQMALNALTRTAILVKASRLSDGIKPQWDAAIARMREKLESLAP